MFGSLISAGASLAGGLLGNSSAKSAAKQNYKHQKEFAQNSIQWKAKDAEAAGISKVFAMGAPTMSFAPSAVGSNFDFLGQAGQDIGRAVQSAQSPQAKTTGITNAAAAIALEGGKLDNELKRTQIASQQKLLQQAGTGVGIPDRATPIPGQPYSVEGPTMELKTKRDLTSADTFSVPGAGPDITMTKTSGGGYTWDTPPQLAESREADPWYKTATGFVRNGLLPFANPHTRVPQEVIDNLPPGTTPFFNPLTQEWTAVRHRGRHLALPYGYGHSKYRR